jgi:tetratricopeptide (TPR) repeat protein
MIMPPAWSQTPAGDRELENVRRQASALARDGRYANAVPLLLKAEELAERQFGPRAPELGAVLSDLAYVYLKLARYPEAATKYERALAIYEGAPGHHEGRVWLILGRLAEVYAHQGRGDEAAALRIRLKAIEQAMSAPFDTEIPQLELITTDLKRVHTRDCGAITFKVDDAKWLLTNFINIETVQLRVGLIIGAAFRKVIGNRSSSQLQSEADRIVAELRRELDAEGNLFGFSVRAMPAQLTTCLK